MIQGNLKGNLILKGRYSMNIAIALEKTEKYLQQQKENIPEEVYNYLSRMCEEDKRYIEMVKSWNKETPSEKLKRLKKGWE